MLFNKSYIFTALALLSVSSAKKIDVKVGDSGLKFEPNNFTAAVGDEVVFHFFPRNHDVAQGPFNTPCRPSPNGFYSGVINGDGSEPDTTFTVRVNDTNPIWMYCATPGHCQGGMAAVINPPANGNSLDDYLAAAEDANSAKPQSVKGGVKAEGSKATGTATGTEDWPSSTSTAGASETSNAASSVFNEGSFALNAFAGLLVASAGFFGIL
ncbi:hypothetical protein AJ80_03908 [Polytolypa hystricis UAMH7299]|uniref:Phytocyanin domain-containing protein n=1 Tax=Polytolypa hystricis (strain UAMH7299) TaxID=1447883 RepID=A0A2B7YFB3_POLH7|nr:hypothetical protein AJ80_03908 [Polytolypa hystricis UAMH7299]